jgi:hypothetical protein
LRGTGRLALLSFLLLGAVCAGPDSNLTDSGQGKPTVAVSFPRHTARAEVAPAVVQVRNPGPGDIHSLVVAFSLVGVGGPAGVADPLVEIGARGRSPSIVDVRPRPDAISSDGVIYRFSSSSGGTTPVLAEGRSLELTFRLRVPDRPGPAASSVQVYAGEEPDRSEGALLETEVTAAGKR